VALKYYLGIDIGGTTIKGLCVNADGEIFAESAVDTESHLGGEVICDNIVKLSDELTKKVKGELLGIGIGCPGMIESASGTIVFAGNLHLNNFPLGETLAKRLNVPIKITNDANAAALGEAKFGAGAKYFDSVFVTLGTGVGGGIIIGGKLFEGGSSAGAEIGHMVIAHGGNPCTCGRCGCFEAYSSATALIDKTRKAMLADRTSKMWRTYNLQTVSGKTAFDYEEDDETAKQVVEWYINYLACGLINIANIFRPQVIMLGGGVSAQGENLTRPLQKIMDSQVFGGNNYASVKVVTATLGNRAGALGAAALAM
jgi:glucokinase